MALDIVIPIYDDFTALDAIGPYEVLSRIGGRVRFVGREAGPVRDRQRHADRAGRGVARRRAGPGRHRRAGRCRHARADHRRGVARLAARGPRDDRSGRRRSAPARCCSARPGSSTGCGRRRTGWSWRRCASTAPSRPGERVVEQGKVVTAAGVSAGIDMALTLAARIAGDEVRARRSSSASSTTRSRRSTRGSVEKSDPVVVEMIRAAWPRGAYASAASRGGPARFAASVRSTEVRRVPCTRLLRGRREPPGPSLRSGAPDGSPRRPSPALRLRPLPSRPGGRGGRGRRRPRRAGRDAHGRGQVALLPAAGAGARRPDDRRLAARVADARPGRGAGAQGSWRCRGRSTPSRTRRPTPRSWRGRAPAR